MRNPIFSMCLLAAILATAAVDRAAAQTSGSLALPQNYEGLSARAYQILTYDELEMLPREERKVLHDQAMAAGREHEAQERALVAKYGNVEFRRTREYQESDRVSMEKEGKIREQGVVLVAAHLPQAAQAAYIAAAAPLWKLQHGDDVAAKKRADEEISKALANAKQFGASPGNTYAFDPANARLYQEKAILQTKGLEEKFRHFMFGPQ